MARGRSFGRLARIGRILTRHGVGHLLARRGRKAPSNSLSGRPAPERLRMLFEDLGGTFVKFGQMLALQPDILPLEYCNALFDLLDRVEGFPYSEVERIVREDFGRTPDEIFDSFEREPLATASVGQVHVAFVDGRKVAVKVQRPEAEGEFADDIRLMVAFMALVRRLRLKPLFWLLEPMGEFVAWTREELDYRYEAAYSERLRGLLGRRPGQYVPAVDLGLTTRRVLTVAFLEGETLLAFLRAKETGDEALIRRLADRGFDRERFAAHVVDNFLDNAFRLGIYHADLHPANLMILEDSEVGYIDFGITGVMSPYARHHLMMMTLALARGDVDLMHEEFLKITVHGPQSDIRGFRTTLGRLAEGWYDGDGADKRLDASFTRIMGEMLQLSRQTDVMPERDIVKYIRSSIAIDGLITRFAPDFNLGSHLAASCARYLRLDLRRTHFSKDRLLESAASVNRLLRDGSTRGVRALDRISAGDLPVRLEVDAGDDQATLRARALQLGTLTFAVALLLVLGGGTVGFGVNLWTAELLFLGGTTVLLFQTLRRLSW